MSDSRKDAKIIEDIRNMLKESQRERDQKEKGETELL